MLDQILNINQPRIAVTELFGAIGSPSRTTEYIRMLRAIEENNRIRGLVIDIDSPGGAAGPSEYLYRSVAKIAKKKPVVAFIRGTGASGAYMVAAGATKIIAVPMALIGSIGVISMRPMLYEALGKIGVRMETTKAGRLKDMFSNFREPTEEERQREQALLNSFYEQFIALVAEARGMPAERVRELATGEVFTSAEAQANGLIDGLGDLDTAIDLAQELARLPERRLTYVRPHRGLRERLLSNTAMALVDSVAWAIEGRLRSHGPYAG
ncbi:MAG TPA: signal peptide peptidase SppA [Dehalococcoidia bacterium]|nr:signal peptide peptidase SppA [Dehalococcoidia bacterium]